MYTKQSNIVDHALYLVYRKEGIALTHENIWSPVIMKEGQLLTNAFKGDTRFARKSQSMSFPEDEVDVSWW